MLSRRPRASQGLHLRLDRRFPVDAFLTHAHLRFLSLDDADNLRGHVDTVALPTRCFPDDSSLYELVDIELGRSRRDFHAFAYGGIRDCGKTEKLVYELEQKRRSPRLLHLRAVGLPESQESIDSLDRIGRLDGYGPEKVPDPLFPFPFLAHRQEVVIVFIPVALEIRAEIEKRLWEQLVVTAHVELTGGGPVFSHSLG